MAKYQNMLVVIDPNQDDQPALRRAVYLHQRIGGRIKAFLPIYDFSYEMTTLLSPDERTAMRQGVISQRSAWIREQAKFYIESGVPIDIKVVWHNRPFEAIIQEIISDKHDLLLKMAHQHDKLEAVIFTPTDWHLLRKCPCPVWMVKDQPWPEGGKALVAVNLVERLPDGHPAPLQFHMNQWKAVDQNRHIIAVIMPRAVCLFYLILVDDLQSVVMDVLLVDQRDIFGASIIPVQHLHIVFLNLPGLFGNMLVGVGNYITEKLLPLRIGKLVVVQLFQLAAEVGNQFILGMQRQIGVALLAQQPDKLFFQFRLALVAVRAHLGGFIGGNNGIFIGSRNDIEKGHFHTRLLLI